MGFEWVDKSQITFYPLPNETLAERENLFHIKDSSHLSDLIIFPLRDEGHPEKEAWCIYRQQYLYLARRRLGIE